MKKIIILIVVSILTIMTSCSEKCLEGLTTVPREEKVLDEYDQLTYSITIDCKGLTKDEIYTRANSYFVYNYGSGKSVIQQQDKEQGILLGKGRATKIHYESSISTNPGYYNIWHILRIDVKEEKARISITASNLEYHYTIKNSYSYTWHQRDIAVNNIYPLVFKKSKWISNSDACLFLKIRESFKNKLEDVSKALIKGNTRVDKW